MHKAAPPRCYELDFIRALAALAVFGGHARNLYFLDYGQLPAKSFVLIPFYFFTSFGHQSVILFFVLSGFLIGGNIERGLKSENFDFGNYFTDRLVRLWVVLLPALLAALVLDRVGIHFCGATGRYGGFSGSNAITQVDLSLRTFLGNCFFLQNLVVPWFGTNGCLWSLTNEFWYYFLYPSFRTFSLRPRALHFGLGLVGVVLCATLLVPILLAGLTWLMGVAAWLVADKVPPTLRNRRWMLRVGSYSIVLVCYLVSVRSGWMSSLSAFQEDFVLGVVVSFLVFELGRPAVDRDLQPPSFLERQVQTVSDFSYSLYLTHLPFLVLAFEFVSPGVRVVPSAATFGNFAAVLAVCLFYSYGFSRLTEAKTYKLRRWVNERISSSLARFGVYYCSPVK